MKCKKSHSSITLIIGASWLFKLLLEKTDSRCRNTAYSPDLNPMNYHICGVMQERPRECTRLQSATWSNCDSGWMAWVPAEGAGRRHWPVAKKTRSLCSDRRWLFRTAPVTLSVSTGPFFHTVQQPVFFQIEPPNDLLFSEPPTFFRRKQ